MKVPFKLEGGDRIDDTPVHKAIREALANCLINTDYYGRCGVVIKKGMDNLILENPGNVRAGKKQMLHGGISDPRNKALMKMFNLIGIGERAGSGVPDIFQTWEKQGWNEPVVEEQYAPDRTILTLALTEKTADKKVRIKSSDKKVRVKTADKKPPIKTADKKPPIKTADKKVTRTREKQYEVLLKGMVAGREYKLVELLDILDLSDRRFREILNGLAELDKIEIIGSNRARRYKRVDD